MHAIRKPRSWLFRTAVFVTVVAAIVRFGNDVCIALETSAPSHSAGTPEHGTLTHGRRLPTSGANFRAYSYLGALLGRNSVHQRVRDAVLDAYERLHAERARTVFVYGETGWQRGGSFSPHHTHQNGLSVDFMVPVRDANGLSVPLATSPLNRFGYAHEFDIAGREGSVSIDFDAMVAHLVALDSAAGRHQLAIRRVIFDPAMHSVLFAAAGGSRLRAMLPFMSRPAWVRHDEHYHVDFALR